jgi:hypothetical protein
MWKERSKAMEIFDRLLVALPPGIEGMGLVFILVSCLLLWFLVPFMVYSMCYRIKTIEWNINYILFGDKTKNARTIKGDWRESLVHWVVAVVEERQRERVKREQKRRDRILSVEPKRQEIKFNPS